MHVAFSREATTDLEQIGDYIATDNPRRAVSFVEELITASIQIGARPNAYPLLPRYERLGIRRRVYGNYLILYQIEEDHIWIHRIVHGARDYGSLLLPEA